MNMRTAWEQAADGLSFDELLSYGLEAVDRLLDDKMAFLAGLVLQKIVQRLQDQPIPAEHRDRLNELKRQCLSAEGTIDEALRSVEEALQEPGSEHRERYLAERAELNFLRGNLDAAGDIDSGESH